jgi:hypothetical protein
MRWYSPISSICHGKSSRSGAVLGLDNLVTTELDTVGQGIQFVSWDVDGWFGLAEKRYDGLARVATNDRNGGLGRVLLAGDLSNEGLGSDNIESGHTEQFLGIKNTSGLEDLCGDWDSGVDGVGDDEEIGLGAVLGASLDEITNNASVDLKEIITGHARLAFSISALLHYLSG